MKIKDCDHKIEMQLSTFEDYFENGKSELKSNIKKRKKLARSARTSCHLM
jgi:hypothetical protein